MSRLVPLALAVAVIACAPAARQADPPPGDTAASERVSERLHPVSGLAIVDVAVDTGKARHVFATELADTPEAQARGLMHRTELGDFEAMLFPSTAPQARSFWMKNTPLALDIVFIGPGGRITNIEPGVPYSLDRVQSDGPAAAVLELRGGRAAQLGIEPGDRVEYDLPEEASAP